MSEELPKTKPELRIPEWPEEYGARERVLNHMSRMGVAVSSLADQLNKKPTKKKEIEAIEKNLGQVVLDLQKILENQE